MLRNLLLFLCLITLTLSAQNAGLAPVGRQQFADSNGAPLAGGLLYTYQSGTNTLLASYTDSSGSFPNSNPIVLDSAGRASIWLGASAYKFVLQTSTGSAVWTVDNIVSPVLANYLPLTGGTVTGSILANGGTTSLGNTSNPFGSLYLNSSLQMAGSIVVDSGRSGYFNNLTVTGTCTGCGGGSTGTFLPLAGGTLTGNLVLNTADINAGPTTVLQNNGSTMDAFFRNVTVTGACNGCGSGGSGAYLPLSGGIMAGSILLGTSGLYSIGGTGAQWFGIYSQNFMVYNEVVPETNGASLGDPGHTFTNVYAQNFTGGNASVNNLQVFGTCSGCGGGGGGTGANVNLSNLVAPTAVNASLLPSGLVTLGSTTALWGNVYTAGLAVGSAGSPGTNASIALYNGTSAGPVTFQGAAPSGYTSGLSIGVLFGSASLQALNSSVDIGNSTTAFRAVYANNYYAGSTAGVTGSTCSAWVKGLCTAP